MTFFRPLWPTRLALALTTLLVSMGALADSTTGTALTITGTATPGKQVVATVVVTGKHLATGFTPGTVSVPGGTIRFIVNGTDIGGIQATQVNSHIIDAGCVRVVQNVCEIVKYIADNTSVQAAIPLPKGVSQYAISAHYTGDDDSHSSDSQVITLRPVYPDVSAAIDLLLND